MRVTNLSKLHDPRAWRKWGAAGALVSYPEMEQCPGCDLQLPANDLRAQVTHMQTEHPEIREQRLRDNGFTQLPDGSWHDDWSSD